MKKFKAKLAALLMTLGCFTVCLGAGVAVAILPEATQVTANAEGTFTITELVKLNGSTDSVIYAYPPNDSRPDEATGWDDGFEFVPDTGKGFLLNGESIDGWEIKQPGDFYIVIPKAAAVGDVVTLDGTFHCSKKNTSFVFQNCSLQWDGTTWKTCHYDDIYCYDIGQLDLHGNSISNADFNKNNGVLFLQREEGVLPVLNWNVAFTYENGNGFTVGDSTTNTLKEMKSTGDGLYLVFDGVPAEGAAVTFGGTYSVTIDDVHHIYKIDNSKFRWTGSAWVDEIDYNAEYTVDAIKPESGDATHVFILPSEGSFGATNDWTNTYPFVTGSGDGLYLNGVKLSTTDIKQPGSLYINLGATAEAGNVLYIDGDFFSTVTEKKITFNECYLQFDGTAWKTYEPVTHNIGALTLHSNSTVGGAKGDNSLLYLTRVDEKALPVLDWGVAFTYESGKGLTVNNEARTPSDIKSTGDGFYWAFGAVDTDSVVSIGGTFNCKPLGIKYVIEESNFQWNGSAWSVYVPPVQYTTYNVGEVKATKDSTAIGVYFAPASGEKFEITDGSWTEKLTFEEGSGVGVLFNGNSAVGDIKIPNDIYVGLGSNAEVGATVVIGGTFYNKTLKVKYVIEKSMFMWSGDKWQKIEAVNVISNLRPTVENSTTNNTVYFKIESAGNKGAQDLPLTNGATFTATTGTVKKADGTALAIRQIKSTADGFTFRIAKQDAGTVLTLSGEFECASLGVKYVIEECQFTWTGSKWDIAYTECEVGQVLIEGNGEANAVYFNKKDGGAFEITDNTWTEKLVFEEGSGVGITLNGTQIVMNDIKIPGKIYANLNTSATTGTIMVVEGTFYNRLLAVKYVIEESKFKWNGTGWEVYSDDVIEYSVHTVGKVKINSTSNASQVYFDKVNGESFENVAGGWSQTWSFEEGSGVGVLFNGNLVVGDIKVPNNLYVGLGSAAQKGATLVIGGTFYNAGLAAKYVIEKSEFFWNGYFWEGVGQYTTYEIGKVYATNEEGTSNSAINFAPWDGSRFEITDGSWAEKLTFAPNSGAGVKLNGEALSTGDIKIPNNLYVGLRVQVDDVVVVIEASVGDVVVIGGTFYNQTLGVIYVIEESACVWNGSVWEVAESADAVAITYTTDYGTFTEYATTDTTYALASGRTYETFIAWRNTATGKVYTAGQEITLTAAMNLEAITVQFFLEEGAAIRLATTREESGIRFTTYINSADMSALSAYGIEVVSYGTLIMPLDYLGAGQQPNLTDFAVGSRVLKIESTKNETEGNYVKYRGAMWTLNEGNYDRLFAGRGYMVVTINGEEKIIYTPFNLEDNVRSIRNVAQKFMADTEEYNSKVAGTVYEAVVETYAAVDTIKLMNYGAYAANNVFNVIAWYHPELDPSNNYDNEKNRAEAEKMKDAGIKAVYLDGKYHLELNIPGNVEKTRQIIQFFWSQGLYTIAFGSNSSDTPSIDYTLDKNNYPDFSDCEGFLGFLAWDEPTSNSFGTLAAFAEKFEALYAGTDAMFMTNLLPSYASPFNKDTHWWQSSKESLQVDTYKAYLQDYCETVLSEIEGEKWLSLDSYPIKADASLMYNFLFDLVMLKQYAEQYGAHSHIVLQSSGWTEGSSTHTRMPTEAELRMQAYTAMALGIDSISWWSYANKRGDGQENPTDNDDYYTRFAKVNNELNAISHVYSAFEWKGVISASGTYDSDAYTLFETGLSQFSNQYKLTTSKTKNLLSVSRSNSSLGYLMGVMEDMNGNEGYVISNYNNHKSTRSTTLTLRFKTNVTEAVIYRGGVAQTVSVSDKKLEIALTTGEGVIVLPSKLG